MLRASIAATIELGEARGWTNATMAAVATGLRAVLADRTRGADAPVRLTEVQGCVPRSSSLVRVCEVLTELQLLHDDTPPSIRAWIDRRSAQLPDGFAGPVRAWLLWLLEGDARRRARSVSTIYVYFGSVRPLLEGWSAERGQLREITHHDVTAAVDQLAGRRRANVLTALRSLFGYARRQRLVFTDPTRGISVSRPDPRVLLPMTDAQIHQVQQTTVTTPQRLVVALVAVHAARAHTIRHLVLDDVDLPNRRITLAGHRQRLGELAYDALVAWLDERRAHWPHTANRHVLISRHSALGTGPVSHYCLKRHLLLRGVQLEQIRGDRILQEAFVSGADPLRLAKVFQLHPATAIAYADIARRVIDTSVEQPR